MVGGVNDQWKREIETVNGTQRFKRFANILVLNVSDANIGVHSIIHYTLHIPYVIL